MSVLVDENTRVLVQGITGRQGSFHTRQMLEYGTKIVAGVTPGKGGTTVEGVPVYDTVEEALQENAVDASVVFVPAPFARDSVLEALDAGIRLIVVITEGIPIQDELLIVEEARRVGAWIIGPNTPGICAVGKTKIGIMPNVVFQKPGNIAIVSRSGTVSYDVADRLLRAGYGVSMMIGIGGDPVPGSRFVDLLPLLEQDPGTHGLIIIGEIGGTDEEEAADLLATLPKLHRNTIAFICGLSAPPGKRMGHAGAIISEGRGGPESKVRAFEKIGIPVPRTLDALSRLLPEVLPNP